MDRQNGSVPSAASAASACPPLLIEGWRGVNHSFAMVNQHQILELLTFEGVRLFHKDLPFAFPHWNRAANAPGFAPSDQQRIDAIPPPPERGIDHIYRIASPFPAPAANEAAKSVTFMITEMGLSAASFRAPKDDKNAFTRDANLIVTSTEWSRERIVDFGFQSDRVKVVPLGVDTNVFSPLSAAERAECRAELGLHDGDIVFSNIGVAVWNKGVDKLLTAFAHLRERGRRVRLILKDQRDVYGISVDSMVKSIGSITPYLLRPETLAAISVIPNNLGRSQLRALYGLSDCYVSPYRAEGFNLPVIEAIACGTPVIVTRGGATDDFCNDLLAQRIPGRLLQHRSDQPDYIGHYIEPDLDDLISAMDRVATGSGTETSAFELARLEMLPRFTWRGAARQVAHLTVDLPLDEPHRTSERGEPFVGHPTIPALRSRRISQREVLDLVSIIAPMRMRDGTKLRLGADHDGGYVVPSAALACEAVLSIGIGGDVSFDLALAQRGARVMQFDHTVAQSPVPHANFTFHRRGWGTVTGGDFLDLHDISLAVAACNAIPNPSRTLLKFDIEGAEYDILASLAPNALAAFDVIVCELHGLSRLHDAPFFDKVQRCLDRLTLHHAPVHLHPNNYRPLAIVEGVPLPDVLELSLLRRDLDVFLGPSSEPIPGPLDQPNHPHHPDLCLTAFSAPTSAMPCSPARRPIGASALA